MAPNTDMNVLLGDRWVDQGPRFPSHSLDVRPPPQEAVVMMAMIMMTMFFSEGAARGHRAWSLRCARGSSQGALRLGELSSLMAMEKLSHWTYSHCHADFS